MRTDFGICRQVNLVIKWQVNAQGFGLIVQGPVTIVYIDFADSTLIYVLFHKHSVISVAMASGYCYIKTFYYRIWLG